MTLPAHFVRSCPRCNGRIIWCDGLATPELTIVDGRVIGCGACFARQRPRPAAPTRPTTPTAPTDTRTVREKLTEEGGRVVDILYAGLDVAERVGDLWRKVKGR
ncbi:MAG TPA: hypothetical protein VKR78_01055 [Acidimicrobiales bacterium]|nr:hypothetical protein [Acidimicrobiales bacterium]